MPPAAVISELLLLLFPVCMCPDLLAPRNKNGPQGLEEEAEMKDHEDCSPILVPLLPQNPVCNANLLPPPPRIDTIFLKIWIWRP